MKCPILLKLNASHYMPTDSKCLEDESHQNQTIELCHGENLNALQDVNILSVSDMRAFFPESFQLYSRKYRVSCQDGYYIFIPMTLSNWLRLRFHGHTSLITESKHIVAQYRHRETDRMLGHLLHEKIDFQSFLSALAQTLGFDHYLLWIYNPITKYIARIESSIDYPKDFIAPDDPSSKLHDFVNHKKLFWRGAAYDEFLKDKGMKWLNRIRLDLQIIDSRTIGILSLYSRHEKFETTEKNQSYIKNCVEIKHRAIRAEEQRAIHKIQKYFIDNYDISNKEHFLDGLVKRIYKILCFQSSVVFLVKGHKQNILIAEANCGTIPTQKDKYDMNSLPPAIATVFKSGKSVFSYDVRDDSLAGKSLNIKHDFQNWIIMPIKTDTHNWGVICVANKYEAKGPGEQKISHFRPVDFISLDLICKSLSHILLIDQEVQKKHEELLEAGQAHQEVERSLKTAKHADEKSQEERMRILRQLEELKDFNKFFLHEVRTPVSTFSMVPWIIKNLIKGQPLKQQIIDSIHNRLNDISFTGEKLEYIANKYNFEELLKYKKIRRSSVLADIVLPVYNITKDFLRVEYDLDIKLDRATFSDRFVYVDKSLISIVLNALIDNAGKYSRLSQQPIKIWGETDAELEYLYICVSSFSFPVLESEVEDIFQKGGRGQHVKLIKIMGTGIGLYISKRIMKEHDGDLLLTSRKNPVTFKIKIPLPL